MTTPPPEPELLRTTTGDVPLREYRLRAGGREWVALHADAVLTSADETRFLTGAAADLAAARTALPLGLVLWPSAVALAHELAARGAALLRGARVLELGAGTGLPGVVAASLGARVVQTDRQSLILHVCRLNAGRNGVTADIEHRLVDWAAWDDPGRYDLILAADVLYAPAAHPHVRRIFAGSLAPGGRVLLADPFRADAVKFLEGMEADGWGVAMTTWDVGHEAATRPIGVFDLTPPG